MPHLLITAGPTREYLDDVRFVSNASSGRMGSALAEAALARGAQVTLVVGPLASAQGLPVAARVLEVVSAEEMLHAVQAHFSACDVFIAAAAVSDYRPRTRMPGKLHKGGDISIEFVRTPDILAWAGEHRNEGGKTARRIVGFSLEPTLAIERGMEKLRAKRCDLLVANTVANLAGEGSDAALLDASGVLVRGRFSKPELARLVIERVL